MDDKDKYIEVGHNYRHFLNWRHQLLAGYLATIAGIIFATGWYLTNDNCIKYTHIVLFVGTIMTLFFWALEYRNRALYRICQEEGKRLENGQGLYCKLCNSSRKNIITHSKTLDIMFCLFASVFIACGIYSIVNFV